jgi:hypothetical protein
VSGAVEHAIRELAEIDRPSASEGERRAAERIAGWLAAKGCRVEVERELAHGGYWWPIGLANGAAVAAAGLALRRRSAAARIVAAGFAALAAAALWDDLGHGRRWFRRAVLPRRPTWNVVAGTGEPDAVRTVALVAHHDAAHSGLVFLPALGRIGPRLTPRAHARASHTLPILYGVWLGPVLVALGAVVRQRRLLRAGAALAAGATVAMTDIGARAVVPGANDNLSAVAILLAIADALERDPVPGNGADARAARRSRPGGRCADRSGAAHGGRHRRDHRSARGIPGGDARVRRGHQAPPQLSLADGHAGQPSLGDDRGCRGDLRLVHPRSRSALTGASPGWKSVVGVTKRVVAEQRPTKRVIRERRALVRDADVGSDVSGRGTALHDRPIGRHPPCEVAHPAECATRACPGHGSGARERHCA